MLLINANSIIRDQFYTWKRDNRISYCGISSNNFNVVLEDNERISLKSSKEYGKLIFFQIENIILID